MRGLASDDLAFLSATEQARLVRDREVASLELVETYLERIERLDPELNAYVTVCAEEAVADARSPRPGPFSGVPLPIKDLSETAGIRTTFSCRAFADYVPERDVEIVRRLRAAGFVILGKTNTPEFGTTAVTESALNGACRNPWDTSRTPGGSSGGAAAAVAAGLAPLAHGSDGGGSIRIPASCCGLFGIKPTRGRISTAPYGDPYGFSTNAPMARTVADAAAFLDVVAGPEPGDQYVAPPPERPFETEVGAPPGRLRVALAVDPPHP
ncbi:MAG: amidase, partial [Gaiellaceae bacterium]